MTEREEREQAAEEKEPKAEAPPNDPATPEPKHYRLEAETGRLGLG